MTRRGSRRRRSHSRARSGRRSFRRGFMRTKGYARSAGGKFWHHAPLLAGLAAFFYTTVRNDVSYANSSGSWKNFTPAQKGQTLVNWFVSRISFGMVPNIFGGGTFGGVLPSFKLGNVLNGTTYAGIGALIVKHIPGIPGRGKIGRFGFPLLLAGIIGGLFDDPAPGRGSVNLATASRGIASAGQIATQGAVNRVLST
jgi:hypothetical protein